MTYTYDTGVFILHNNGSNVFYCFVALLTDPVDLVIVRLKQWLCDLDPSKLPKTRDKLKTSIRPMCRLKYVKIPEKSC
jgi:hypothetical protein